MKISGFVAALVLTTGGAIGHVHSASAALAANSVAAAYAHVATAPARDWTGQVAATPDGGFVMGNPNAPVKLIEYGSRTCPHCARFAKEGEPLLKSKYVATGKVSYEFRDFPIHAPDLAAILLGQCNGAGPFFPILDATMADQERVLGLWGSLPPSVSTDLAGKSPTAQSAIWADKLGYIKFAVQHGVPATKARACLADVKAVDVLGRHIADGVKKFGVDQTPFFIINGIPAKGVNDWAALESALKAAGRL